MNISLLRWVYGAVFPLSGLDHWASLKVSKLSTQPVAVFVVEPARQLKVGAFVEHRELRHPNRRRSRCQRGLIGFYLVPEQIVPSRLLCRFQSSVGAVSALGWRVATRSLPRHRWQMSEPEATEVGNARFRETWRLLLLVVSSKVAPHAQAAHEGQPASSRPNGRR